MTHFKDSLASMTNVMAMQITGGGISGYRDRPFDTPGMMLDGFYKNSWIAKAVVERIPEDCFKKGYTWVAEAEQLSAIEATEKRLKIKSKKKRAMQMARLDGEAYLYFDTGQTPSEPLVVASVGRERLRFVNLLRKTEIVKGRAITDPVSEFYGEPEYYEVAGSDAANMVRIHPSRICRFIRNPDPMSSEGISDLVSVAATIIAAETTRDNVTALTTEACLDIMSVDGLMQAVRDPEEEAAMVKRYALFRQMKQTNAMGVIDKEHEEYKKHPQSFSTLPDVIETMRREVAAAAEIPYSLLFGRASGLGSNGEMELATYYDSIKTMQENDIQPACELLDECIIRSALGSRPAEIYMQWESLWQVSDKERAEIGKLIADTTSALTSSGVIPAEVLTESTVNALTENGSFPGLEQTYKEWVDAGGPDELDNNADELPADDGSDSVTP